jgi:hypothetical protein
VSTSDLGTISRFCRSWPISSACVPRPAFIEPLESAAVQGHTDNINVSGAPDRGAQPTRHWQQR